MYIYIYIYIYIYEYIYNRKMYIFKSCTLIYAYSCVFIFMSSYMCA